MRKSSTFVLAGLALVTAAGTHCGLGQNDSGTGNLRLLITDKPYPYEWIESALVTITKVEIRRAGSSLCEDACDDGLWCNGFENCVDGECRNGIAPCGENELCDEPSASCREHCESDGECDDGLVCDGAETCNVDTGACVAGEAPCGPGLFCHEEGILCNEDCGTEADCNDGLYCNGEETCDLVSGDCLAGTAPDCGDDGCDEASDSCGSQPATVSPFIVIFEGERTFDLLDLQNGRADLLAEAQDIPAGFYNLMRVYVTRGQVILKDGAGVFDLTVPSGAQTGIKLHFDFEIPAGGEAQLLLDVDLSRAFGALPSGHR